MMVVKRSPSSRDDMPTPDKSVVGEKMKTCKSSWEESKLLWHIAFPAILTAVFQFSIGFVTVGFAGHIGEAELAAVTVVENVIEGFSYGVLVRTLTSLVHASPLLQC